MGAGSRKEQFENRFSQGKPCWSREKENCSEGKVLVAGFRDYEIYQGRQGYELSKGKKTVGIFDDVSLESERAIFKLSWGMLLEVTEEGVREIFSKEKAGLHALTASDGGLYRGKPPHGIYEIKFESKSPELVDLYAQYFKDVYGLEMHRGFDKGYPRVKISNKMAFYDLKNYGAKTGPYTWEVPTSYLDKEGAREWFKCFFSGDGLPKKA